MHSSNVVSAWVLNAHDALLGAAEGEGLDARELAALTLISSHEGCSIEWLRARVALTQSGTVRLIDRLQSDGLVRRERPDGRAVALTLTGRGADRLVGWNAARDRVVDQLLGGLAAGVRRQVVDSLAATLLQRSRERAQADVVCRACEWPACGEECPVDGSVG